MCVCVCVCACECFCTALSDLHALFTYFLFPQAHPDKGGDAATFNRVQKAYKKLKAHFDEVAQRASCRELEYEVEIDKVRREGKEREGGGC